MSSRLHLIERYFAACGAGDESTMRSVLHPNAVIYDLNHRPVEGIDAIVGFWESVRRRWAGATWHVDESVSSADAVAVEWSMRGEHGGEPFVVHGSDHYSFEDERILQIRQYWIFDPTDPGGGLVGYPYPERSHRG